MTLPKLTGNVTAGVGTAKPTPPANQPNPTQGGIGAIAGAAKKFWQSDNFKNFVSAVNQKQKEKESVVVQMAKGANRMVAGMNIAEQPKFAGAIVTAKQRKLIDVLPKNEYDQLPRFSPDLSIGDRIYFNVEKGEFTGDIHSGPNVMPVYYEDIFEAGEVGSRKTFSLKETKEPAFFTSDFALDTAGLYDDLLTSYPDMIAKEAEQAQLARQGYKPVEGPALAKSMADTGRAAEGKTVVYKNDVKGGDAEFLTFVKQRGDFWSKLVAIFSEPDYVVEEFLNSTQASGGAGDLLKIVLNNASAALTYVLNSIPARTPSLLELKARESENLVVERAAEDQAYRDKRIKLYGFTPQRLEATKKTWQHFLKVGLFTNNVTPQTLNQLSRGEITMDEAKEQLKSVAAPQLNVFKSLFNPEADYIRFTKELKSAATLHTEAYGEWQGILAQGRNATPQEWQSVSGKLIEAYRIESTIGYRNVYSAYSFLTDSMEQEAFFAAMAQVELQLARPLTRSEKMQLRDKFTDPTVEIAGQIMFSLQNILEVPVAGLVKSIPKATSIGKFLNDIPNVQTLSVGGLITKTTGAIVSKATKGTWNGLIDLVHARPYFDALTEVMMKGNLGYEKALPMSKRWVATQLINDTDYLFVKSMGLASDIVGNPETFFTSIKNIASELVSRKAKGETLDVIIPDLLKSKKYPAAMLTEKKLRIIDRLAGVANVVVNKKGEVVLSGLDNLLTKGYNATIKERTKELFTKYFGQVDFKNPAARTGVLAIDDILEAAENKAADLSEFTKEVIQELQALAAKNAESAMSIDQLGLKIGSEFAEVFKEKNLVWDGAVLMKDQFSGAIAKRLAKGGTKFGKLGAETLNFWANIWGNLWNQVVNNYLTRVPRFFVTYTTIDNTLTYLFSGVGGAFSRLNDLFVNTPRLLENISNTPLEARRGLMGVIGMSEDIANVDDLVDFYSKNKNFWLPIPGTLKMYFDKKYREEYSKWVEKFLTKHNISEVADQQSFLLKAAANKRLVSVLSTPDGKGKLLSIFGKPLPDAYSKVKMAFSSWSEMGKSVVSANELVVRANIAQEHYIQNLRLVAESVISRAADDAATVLREAGAGEQFIADFMDTLRAAATDAEGSTTKFIHKMNVDEMVKNPVRSVAYVPEATRKIPTGMSQSEVYNLTVRINSSLNDYLTGLRAGGTDITPDHIADFFKQTFKSISSEIDEGLNPAGLVGYSIFGDSVGSRPISSATNNLLNKFERGEVVDTYGKGVRTILENNGIDTTGKTAKEAVAELHNQIRPSVPKLSDAQIVRFMEDMPVQSVHSLYNDTIKEAYEKLGDIGKLSKETMLAGKDDARLREMSAHILRGGNKEIEVAGEKFTKPMGRLLGIQRAMAERLDDPAIRELYDTVNTIIDNINYYGVRITSDQYGIMPNVFPGYDKIVSQERFDKVAELAAKEGRPVEAALMEVGTRTTKNELIEVATGLRTRYLDMETSYLEGLVSALERKAMLPIETTEQLLEKYGFKFVRSADGNSIDAVLIFNPVSKEWLTRIEKTDPRFATIVSPTYLGITNPNVLDTTLSMSQKEIDKVRLSSKVPKPILRGVTEDAIPELRKGYFNALMSAPYTNSKNTLRQFVEPLIYPQKLDDLAPEEVLDLIRKKAASAPERVKDNLEELADTLEHSVNYYEQRFLRGNTRYSTPIKVRTLPDDMRAWVQYKSSRSAEYMGVKNMMGEWENFTKEQLSKGKLFPKKVGKETIASAKAAVDAATKRFSEMEDILWYGGKLNDMPIDGAIPYMKGRMRLGDETVLDQAMKSFVPFWNFGTRGSKAWLRVAMEHPELVAHYYRYLRASRGYAYQRGAVDSQGRQLKSTRGKIPIPGTDLWINPLTASPFFNYVWLPPDERDYGDNEEMVDDLSGYAEKLNLAMRGRGFRVSPLVDIVLAVFKVEDDYTTQTPGQKFLNLGFNAVIPAEILPPFIWDMVDAVARKISKPNAPDTWRPQVAWFHYIIEKNMAKDVLMQMQNLSSTEAKMDLATQLHNALDEREGNTMWDKYHKEAIEGDYYKSLVGWFTGFYAKEFTAADAEMNALRNSINAAYAAINNEVVATVFFPYRDAEDIYKYTTDLSYKTAEGKLYQIRKAFSWVEDETTHTPLVGEERLKQISATMDENEATESYYDARAEAFAEFDAKMRTIPIGREYSDDRATKYRQELQDVLASIEGNDVFDIARRGWGIGYKPESMVYGDYANLWADLLNATRPTWNKEQGESYPDYQAKIAAWEDNLPKIGQELYPIFLQNFFVTDPTAYGGQQVSDIPAKLLAETNADNLNKWNMSRDTATEALTRAWEVMYSDKFFAATNGLHGNQYDLAVEQWLAANPKPTTAELVAQVQKMYGNQFTFFELSKAASTPAEQATARGILDIEQSQMVGKSDEEKTFSAIYDLYGWIPSNRKSEFYKVFQTLGGDIDTLTTFFNVPDYTSFRKDPAKLKKLYADMAQTIERMQVTKPEGEQLIRLAQAEELNDQLKAMLLQELGEGYEDIVNSYKSITSSSVKRAWQKEHPDWYAIVKKYDTIRTSFGNQNPMWKDAYTSKPSTSYYGGSGGGSGYSRSGGGRAVVRTPEGKLMPMGFRNTKDANKLLNPDNLGKGGVAGMPKWSADLYGKTPVSLRVEMYELITSGQTLSTAAINYLKRIGERYPEYKADIDVYLATLS